MLEDRLLAVGIAEGHVAEGNVAPDRLPVFLFRREAVAVALDDLRRVAHVRLSLQQLRQALDVYLCRDQIRDRVHDPADRLHQPHRVAHEHGERADLRFGDVPALPEHHRERERGGEIHRHGEEPAQARRADGSAADAARVGHKGVRHRVLDHERFDRPRAGDALVEVRGDLRIDLADLAVGAGQPPLEDREEQHRERQHGDDHERKPRVDREHHDHGADDVAHLPQAVQQRPGDERADLLRVGHHARVQIAHAVLVEEGEGERLQMAEGRVPEILVHADLDAHAADAGDVVHRRAAADQQQIQQHEHDDRVERSLADEVVERIPLEERHADVHERPDEAAEDHHGGGAFVVFQIRQDLPDPKEGETHGFGGVLLHATTSELLCWISQIFW